MSNDAPPGDQKGFRGFDSFLSQVDPEETRLFNVASQEEVDKSKEKQIPKHSKTTKRDYSHLMPEKSHALGIFASTKNGIKDLKYLKWILVLVLVVAGFWFFSPGQIGELTTTQNPSVPAKNNNVKAPPGKTHAPSNDNSTAEHASGKSGDKIAGYIEESQKALKSRNSETLRNTSQRWIKVQPKNDIPWNYLGIAYYLLGQYDESVAAFQRAVSLAPNEKTISANLAKAKAALAKAGPTASESSMPSAQGLANNNNTVDESPSKQLVKKIQRYLKQLHYNSGPVDGIYGTQTEQAIRNYQKSVGLKPDGEVSEALLQRIEKAVTGDTGSESQ